MSESAPPAAPIFGDPVDHRLVMLPDELAAAVVAARELTKDVSVFARIEAYDDRPGFVTVERGGVDLQVGLSQADAIPYLEALR